MMLEGSNSSTAISWVREDLDDCLSHVRENLERFAEDSSERKPLSAVQEYLEQLHLTFNTMGQIGASMLTDEMIAVGGQMLHSGNFNDRDSLAALTDAVIVLPSYLDRLEAGHEDLPILLLPTLNELRATYDETLLSEGTLFAPDLDVVIPLLSSCESAAIPETEFRSYVRKRRREFQSALLGWLQEQNNDQRLEPLFEVCQTLYRHLGRFDLRRLWYIAAEVLSGLEDGSIDNDLPLRRLFARLDLTLKSMSDSGERGPLEEAVVALSRALLFHAAQARPGSPATDRLRTHFRLEELIPDREALMRARGAVTGRDAELFRSIGEAVREELAQVKDTLDMELRTGVIEQDLRTASVTSLEQLGDTLHMLNLPVAAKAVTGLLPSLKNTDDVSNTDLDSPLMALAQRLLEVESILDTHIQLLGEPIEEAEDTGPLPLPPHERRRIISAMLAETVRSLSEAQEAVRDRLEGVSEADYILPLQEIAGALELADMEEVAALTRKLERAVNAALFALRPDDDSGESSGKKDDEPKVDLDSLTDAVAALELYLTGCRDQQANSTRYLEIMQARLEGLPEASASGESLPNTSIKLPDLRSATSVAVPESGQEELDDEIRAVFLEEFAGVESQLLESATAWRENIIDPQLIIEIRRGFHTLKGSGRMVGANEIGDFSWDFEQLLNAASENRIEVDSTVHMLVSLAVTALRDLKARMLQQHTDLEAVAVMRLRDCARQLAEGIPPSLAALKQSLPEHLASLVRGVPDSEMTDSQARPKARDSMDPSLAKLMIGELQQHQALLTPFVEQVEIGSAIGDANLIQAVHTLAGTLALAPLGDEARIAGALEKLLQESLNRRVPLTARAGLLLRRCLDRFALRLALLEETSEEEFPSQDASLLQSLAEMTGNLDQIASDIPDAVLQADHTPEPESTATPVTETPADITTTVSADESIVAEETGVAEDPAMDVEDMDILIIFLDEAIEVLERCDSLLNDWRSKLSDQKLVQNLQREIHTFKGGARMAGLHPLGELSHAMETLLEQIAGNRLQATIAAVQALEEGCDQLNIWVEQLNGNVMPEAGQALDRFIKKSEALALLPSGQAETVDTPAAAAVEPDIQQPETPQEDESLQVTGQVAADELATGTETPSEDDSEAMRDAVLAQNEQAEAKAEEKDFLADVEPVEIASVSQTPVVHEVVALPDQNPPDRKLRDITERPVTDSTDDSRGQPHIRVASGLMDTLVNYAGEVSIYRARLEQQLGTVRFNLNEADGTVERLKEQLRKMDIETEAQMLSRYKHAAGDGSSEFDPLELDRFSNMQQLSRSLTETVSDLMSLQAMLDDSVRQAESLLVQQSRVSSDLQEGLMQTRMTPFGSAAPRLRRVVRTAATETGKKARLQLRVAGSSDQLDRNVLERITAPLEHLLRNAVVHGIESPKSRRKLKKPEEGVITVTVEAETTEFVIRVQDDGAGVNIDNVRKRAIERGMIKETDDVPQARLIEFILESGFSTTETVTGLAGRGVGMDVVNSEVKQIGGSLEIGSEVNRGTSFTIRIPFSLAVMQAIGVQLGERPYMIPLNSVAGVTRVAPSEYATLLESASPSYEFAGEQFPILDLEHMLGENSQPLDSDYVSLLMVRSGEHTAAFHIPEIQGHQEIIIKPVGPQISSIPGILGGTISGDGQVVLILDIGPLIRRGLAQLSESAPVVHKTPEKPAVPLVMVVDDSITMRKVTSRVLESHGLDVMTAKDGVDALEKLGEEIPALILLDIEMPRMDGYELAEHVRADARLREIPIIMITSRAGQKHRKKARKAGANDYLTKPYQEPDLIAKVGEMLETSLGAQGGM